MNFYCFLLVMNINFKLVKLMELSPEFWTSLVDYGDGGGDGGYNFQNRQQNNAAFNSATYNRQQSQYQKNLNQRKKPTYIIPDNSKEQLYIYLDKGKPHYMPLNEHERPRISHSTFNINGRNVPLDWNLNKNKFYNHKNNINKHQRKHRNYYKNRNFGKKRGCHEKSDRKNYRPNWWGTAYDFEFESDMRSQRPCENFIEQRNYKKKYNKCENNNNFNECIQQNRKPNFTEDNQERNQNTNNDCNSNDATKNALSKSTVTIQQSNIQVETENKVLVGSSKAENNETQSILLQTENPNEEMLGSILTTPETSTPNVSTPENLQTTTEKSFLTMHKGIVNVSPLTAAEINSLNNVKIIVIHERNPETQVHFVGGATTESSISDPNSLTDSPIYYIQLLDQNQNFKQKKPKTLQPPHTPNFEENLLGNGIQENPFPEAISQPPKTLIPNATSDALLINSLSEVPNNLDGSDITTEISFMAPMNGNGSSINSVSVTSEPILEQFKIESEPEQTIDDSADLKPSENRIYEYVTKLDQTAPLQQNHKNEINYMEPIGYETFLMGPKFQDNQKARYYHSKYKQNSKLQKIKPRKRKSIIILTTPKGTNITTFENTTAKPPPKPSTDTLKTPKTAVYSFERNTDNNGSQTKMTEFIENSFQKIDKRITREPQSLDILSNNRSPSKKLRSKQVKKQQISLNKNQGKNWEQSPDPKSQEDNNDASNDVQVHSKKLQNRKTQKQRNFSKKSNEKRMEESRKFPKKFRSKKIKNPRSYDRSNELTYFSKKFSGKQIENPQNPLKKSRSKQLRKSHNSLKKNRNKEGDKLQKVRKQPTGSQNSSKYFRSKHLKRSQQPRSRLQNPSQKFPTKPQDLKVVGSSRLSFTTSQEDPCENERFKLGNENYYNDEDGISEHEDQYIYMDNNLDVSTSEDTDIIDNEIHDDEENEPSDYESEESSEFQNHGQEIQIAEMKNLGADCDYSNEVSYDGDQYLQTIDVLTPATMISQSVPC